MGLGISLTATAVWTEKRYVLCLNSVNLYIAMQLAGLQTRKDLYTILLSQFYSLFVTGGCFAISFP